MVSSIVASHRARYPVEELLSLRNSLAVVRCVVGKLNKHPDIAEIFRIPDSALQDPHHYSCLSRTLADATNQRKIWQGSRRTDSSTDKSDGQVASLFKLNHSRPQQWNLRRRDLSHRSSEPHPAPSGIVSQQSENFQRFYRAVVSPTHVRVTAGGRIVPNTRAIAPPQFNWNPDKCLFEPSRSFADINSITAVAQEPRLANPEHPVVLSPLSSLPLPNYDSHPQSSPPNQANMAVQGLPTDQSAVEQGQISKEATKPTAPTSGQQSIKISPPSQFDHSRPFMFNGQLVYPVPNGFQPPPNAFPLPMSVLGNPNLQHHIPAPATFAPQTFPMPVPMGNFGGPFMMPPGPMNQYPTMLPTGMPHVDGGFNVSPYRPQPAPDMVSLSDLTKFQIQGFRTQVQQIDHQIASHQNLANEPFLQYQRSELIGFLEKMESMLHNQLNQQGNYVSTEALTSRHHAENGRIDEHAKPIVTEPKARKSSTVASPAVVPPIPLFVPSPQASEAHTQTEGSFTQKPAVESKNVVKSEPPTKSRLSAAAAMAPPFQPRAQTVAHRLESSLATDPPGQMSTALVLSTAQATTSYHERPSSRRSEVSSVFSTRSGHGHATMPRAHSLQAAQVDVISSGPHRRAETFRAASSQAQADYYDPFIPSTALPYLIGSLPLGKHASEVHGTDIGYARPLTEEETRARHLYWGNAPRSALKGSGLPKFDGKDFYPPSPIKKLAPPYEYFEGHEDVALPDFEHIFDEPGKTPPRARSKTAEQKAEVFDTSRIFLDNHVIGYESPSPRPATYRFENGTSTEWYSTKYAVDDSAREMNTKPLIAPHKDTNFSTLFSSQTADQSTQSYQNEEIAEPVTPDYKGRGESAMSDEDETGSLDSWGVPKVSIETCKDDVTSNKATERASPSVVSTVEFHLTSKDADSSPERKYGTAFAERCIANTSDQHTAFLQNMLRNAVSKPKPALSGAITAATAQGYLPQYRGSAAASLAPTMLTMNTMEREEDSASTKTEQARILVDNAIKATLSTVVPLKAENFLPENRPTNRDRPYRPIMASAETMGAEGYMRYLAQKAEDDKKILEQGWNSKTTAKGPVLAGSEW